MYVNTCARGCTRTASWHGTNLRVISSAQVLLRTRWQTVQRALTASWPRRQPFGSLLSLSLQFQPGCAAATSSGLHPNRALLKMLKQSNCTVRMHLYLYLYLFRIRAYLYVCLSIYLSINMCIHALPPLKPTYVSSEVQLFQIFRNPHFQNSRNPDLQKSRCPEIQISRNPDLQKSRSPEIQISRNPDCQNSRAELLIWRPPNLKICKAPFLENSRTPDLSEDSKFWDSEIWSSGVQIWSSEVLEIWISRVLDWKSVDLEV